MNKVKNSNILSFTPSVEITTTYIQKKIIDVLLMIFFLLIIYFMHTKLISIFNIFYSNIYLKLILITFAVFRLSRLLISDAIMQWFRDIFLCVDVEKDNEQFKIIRSLPSKGVIREIALLFDCPWCTSVWISLFILMTWEIIFFQALYLVLAFSGMSLLLYFGVEKLQ